MIDALFGSKTRVKLLHLFLNNPGKSFYVREITRLIDEQINSVRRELANMLDVGVIQSDSADNKLYYEVNQGYEFYTAFRAIFADEAITPKKASPAASKAQTRAVAEEDAIQAIIAKLPGVRLAVAAGALVRGSASPVDLLIVGTTPKTKLSAAMKKIEAHAGRELNYSLIPYDEFYYRLSVRDKFITEIVNGKCSVMIDSDQLLADKK